MAAYFALAICLVPICRGLASAAEVEG